MSEAVVAAAGAGTSTIPTAHSTATAPAAGATSSRPPGDYRLIPVDQVHPARDNPRKDRGALHDLVASIKRQGILEPLLVEARGDHFRIVAGERRWAAAKHAGLSEVPCIIRGEVDDYERLEDMLVENLQRRGLKPLEEAQAFERMQLELGYTQAEIAAAIGKSQAYVSRRVRLLTLPAPVRRQVAAGKVAMNEALGYQVAGPVDLFEADDDVQRAWLALRQDAIDSGDRRSLRLLAEFAKAFKVYKAALEQRIARGGGGSFEP